VRGDVIESGRIVAFAYDDHTVFHRAVCTQICDRLRHSGRALTDRIVDANDVLAALVENRVDGNGGLARLSVAQNQLSLAAPHRHERVDDLDARLQGHYDRRAIHDRLRIALDGQA